MHGEYIMMTWKRLRRCRPFDVRVPLTCRMDRDLATLQEKTEIINRKRKQAQEEGVDKLYATQYQALEMQMKNYHIQVSV